MAGSNPVANPVAAGVVMKPFSADGSHFIFGSEQQFEPAGNPDNGNVTIYSRDLKSSTTEVASTDTNGKALADGSNVAELDVSNNGQRVVIGDLVHTDSAGNHYYHLYMHVAGNPDSIDLTPGSPDGALYDGMSSDGTKVYFTTADVPAGASDGDTSADIYRADVTNSDATLTRVSTGTGGTGDTDSCNPAANTIRTHWNTVGPDPNCDAVAVGGGGGVASGDGSIYFLSPELLDGGSNGVPNAPNLYVARPGSAPHFIRTLESSANAPLPPLTHPFRRSFSASFSNPAGVAIDHASGDIYVFDIGTGAGTGYVYKFDPSGQPFRASATSGKLDRSGATSAFTTSLRRSRSTTTRAAQTTATSTSPISSTTSSKCLTPRASTSLTSIRGATPPPSGSIRPTATFTLPRDISSKAQLTSTTPAATRSKASPRSPPPPGSPSIRAGMPTSSTAAAPSAPPGPRRNMTPRAATSDSSIRAAQARWPSIPQTTTSTSTRATGWSSSTRPETRSEPQPARG